MTSPSPGGVRLYRIAQDTPTYEADDRSGAGAKMTGGRWNRPDTALLYTATTRALAGFETLVHLAPGGMFPFNRYLVEVEVPAAAWAHRVVFDAADAAFVGWDAEPPGRVSLAWGTTWAADGTSLLAEVPSVIVPEESNVLINPAHPEMSAVIVRKVRRWLYDPRLLDRRPAVS